ncbi:MAG: hypothetical protein KGJ10_06700 [Acidobacteriota bacterium]|nr:hypothetical protein [Acidobacteriota bacterium]
MPSSLFEVFVANTNWVTVSSLATAAGTLVLAIATFASIRSANRSARIAEESLLAGVRPLLMPSKPEDSPMMIKFIDDHGVRVGGGEGSAEVGDDAIYLTMLLRNVGNGIAVLHGWRMEFNAIGAPKEPPSPELFRTLTRGLYVAPADVGFWQGTYRDRNDEEFVLVASKIAARERLFIDVLYGDHLGGQRFVSRFGLTPEDGDTWSVAVGRHWNLDRVTRR